MAYSISDLATRALRKANLIGAEETASAADMEYAEESITSDTAALAVEGIVILNGTEQVIPVEQLEPLARYYAITFKEDYGLMPTVQAIQAREFEKRILWKLCQVGPTGELADAYYY